MFRAFRASHRLPTTSKLCPAIKKHGFQRQQRSIRKVLHLRRSTGTADNAGTEGATGAAAVPDPWLAPADIAEAVGTAAEPNFPAALPTSSVVIGKVAPPSPWDNPALNSTAQPATSSGGPAEAPARATQPTHVSASTSDGSADSKGSGRAALHVSDVNGAGDGSAAAAGAAAPPAAEPSLSPPSPNDATTATTAATISTSTTATIGSGASGGSGGDPPKFNVREASAALSEDTAALLTRLRAELARASSIKMPPRRAGLNAAAGAGSSSSSSSSSSSRGSSSSSSSSIRATTAGAATGSGTGGGDGAANVGSRSSGQESVSSSVPDSASRVNGSTARDESRSQDIHSASGGGNGQGSGYGSGGGNGTASSTGGTVGASTASGNGAGGAAAEGPVGSASNPPVKMSTAALAAALAAAEDAAVRRPVNANGGADAAPRKESQGKGNGFLGMLMQKLGPVSEHDPTAEADPSAPAAETASAAATGSTTAAAAAASSSSLSSSLSGAAGPVPASNLAATASTPLSTSTSSPPTSSPTPTPKPTPTPTLSPGASPSTAAAVRDAVSRAGARVSGGGSGSKGGKRRAIVVGGGVGGLVSAARLAKEGFSVVLLEANSQVGGRCQSVQRGRFRFDTGPSLLLFIETYRKAFAALGTSLPQQVPVVRVTPAAYRVFFQGAGFLDLLYDVQRMVEQLEGVEKGAGGQYLDWLASARTALQLGVEGFIERDADSLPELVAGAVQDGELRSLLSSVGLVELLGTHYARMSRRFRDPRLRALFTFQDLYVGLTPYTAPAVYSLLAATEVTDGVWYPLGGFGQVRDALLRVGQGLGVRLRCGARVAAIRTGPGEGGTQRVAGVTLASGEELEADVVVSNRDVPLTYELLRGPAETHGSVQARRILSQDYSAGVIAFNWSVDRKLEQLLHHNVFLSGDFAGSWERATSPETLARSPNFYVHCPTRTDPTAAPPGSDSVMVLLPVANIQEIVKAKEEERRRNSPLATSLPGPLGQQVAGLATVAGVGGGVRGAAAAAAAAASVDYSGLVAAGRDAVLRSLAEAGIPDVRSHIVDEMVIDPLEWRDRYSLAHGAAFGLSHGLSQLSVFRPGVADQQVRGLYLVGASTRPGNGVPLTMISADLVTQRVLKDVAAGVL